MYKHEYQLKVAWEQNWRTLKPEKVTIVAKPNNNSKIMDFTHGGISYQYEWRANPSSGLASLYKKESDGKVKCVYNAYMRNPEPEYVALIDAARQLFQEIKKTL